MGSKRPEREVSMKKFREGLWEYIIDPYGFADNGLERFIAVYGAVTTICLFFIKG
jgi:hypothetical protein